MIGTRRAVARLGDDYERRVLRTNPIVHWPLWEERGAVAQDVSGNGWHGAHVAVLLGQKGIGDGRYGAGYDGSTSLVDVYSAGLAGAFSGLEGSFLSWCNVANAGVWTDGSYRTIVMLRVDLDNRLFLRKQTSDNSLAVYYFAAGTAVSITTSALEGELGWFPFIATWSRSGSGLCLYAKGVLIGGPSAITTNWTGALSSTYALIAAASQTPSNTWEGSLAHVAIWNRALTPSEVYDLSVVCR